MSEVFRVEKEIAGRKLVIETGKLAKQANGSVTVSYGDTVILGTAVISKNTREGLDFFPLTVEFEERFYAAGRIKGSRFMKRDGGRPTDEAVLNGRMIDRAIRPLFDEQIRNEVQVILTILSYDGETEPGMVGMIAASTALAMSSIPWNGPIAGVNIGADESGLILNPTVSQIEASPFKLSLAGTTNKIIMVESQANEVPADKMNEAFSLGNESFKEIVDLINEMVQKAGKEKLNILDLLPQETEETLKAKEDIMKKADEFISEKVNPYLLDEKKPTKALRKHGVYELVDELEKQLIEQEIDEELIAYAVNKAPKLAEKKVSAAIMEREIRVDGRKLDEIRPLSFETSIIKRTHGTGLFSRGETQVLSNVTLGSPGDVQLLDTMEKQGEKRYIHHYTFAPFSVGEVKRLGYGRRDIGHGALAEKALIPVIPSKEEFPYTILVVSETLGSNGSSSMASTCGSTLALLDAGVPLKAPVAGIAMGLAVDGKGGYKILTDIQDLEDGPGGMDFKITGTKDGFTAMQMDTKTDGLTMEMVEKTLTQGTQALKQVLEGINKAIPQANKMSEFAPRITTVRIDPAKIKDVIGPGGKVINEIVDETGVNIDIEDDGLVMITGTDAAMAKKAQEWVEMIVKDIEVGETYDGKVIKILDFGAIVEMLPGKDGMIHISKMAPFRIEKVTDVLNEGDQVKVKVEEVDKVNKRTSLLLLEGGKTPKPSPNGFSQGPRRRDDRPKKPFFQKRDR